MMGIRDDYKLFSLRVQNMTRSCILLKRYDNDIWTMPVLVIEKTEDPMNYLDEILKQVATDDKFEVISMVAMLEWNQEDCRGVDQHSIICDLRYTGKVLPTLTAASSEKFVASKWMPKGMLDTFKGKVNFPLYAYINAVRKETCLQ